MPVKLFARIRTEDCRVERLSREVVVLLRKYDDAKWPQLSREVARIKPFEKTPPNIELSDDDSDDNDLSNLSTGAAMGRQAVRDLKRQAKGPRAASGTQRLASTLWPDVLVLAVATGMLYKCPFHQGRGVVQHAGHARHTVARYPP